MGGAAGRHPLHLRPTGHPRGREKPSDLRRGRAVRVRSDLQLHPEGPRRPGRDLRGHRYRRARIPRPGEEVLRHRREPRRQQVRRPQHCRMVRWLVRVRAEGRARGHPATGLLPHQHAGHGPVRAYADHRRRRLLRALRRGMHRPDLVRGLAARRHRRDHRRKARPRALHHRAELVEQRLQPRHPACLRARGRHDGMGRRQHRFQGHHEVPGLHPRRTVRQGIHHVPWLRRQGPVPGHGREDDSPRPAHQLHHRRQVHFPWWWPLRLPRSGQNRQGRVRFVQLDRVRCPAGRRLLPLRYLPACRRSRRRRFDGPRSHRFQDFRRPALLPDEPRSHGGRGARHDRARLRRTDQP